MSMRTDDFDYNLPEELIAQAPAEPRDSCRLLVVDRMGSQAGTPLEHGGTVEHRIFRDIIDYIEPGDVLVINKTRVMPARLIGRKAGSGGVVETLLLKRREDVDPLVDVWECLVKPGKRLKPGAQIEYRAGGAHAPEGAPVVLTAEVVDFVTDSRGGRLVRFERPVVTMPLESRARSTRPFMLPVTFRCRPTLPITRAIPRSTRPSTP